MRPDRGVEVDIRVGVVTGRARVQEVVAIDNVEEIDESVLLKVRMQREAEHSVVAPVRDFVVDVDERRREFRAIFHEPDAAGALPDAEAVRALRTWVDGEADWVDPSVADELLGESRRQREGAKRQSECRP